VDPGKEATVDPGKRLALITGIAGGLGRLVAGRFHRRGYQVVGVDYRRCDPLPVPATLYQAAYHKSRIEDIFRRHRPTHVLHLGRVGDLRQRIEQRYNLNVVGSRRVMDLALRFRARRLVVLSTFHIYGAHPLNHIPISEDEPPRAGTEFPQIADAIDLDNAAVVWAYQHPELETAVLRPTNVIGPDIRNAMSTFLRLPRVPVMMGFDPMTQFIHQDDLAEAIVRMAEDHLVGAFNVAGPRPVPWRKALRAIDARVLPIPTTVALGYLRLAGLVTDAFPPYLVNFLKFSCVISDEKIRLALDWRPEVEPEEALRSAVRR
jgi:UDP-glucose 4-epimerase